MHNTPRRVRIGLRNGTVGIVTCFPPPPKNLSSFQKTRLRKAFFVVSMYLKKGLSVKQIASRRRCTHQRISQTLKLGIDHLIETGRIYFVNKLAA